MLIKILCITNIAFNLFFGLTCGLIAFTMIKNRKAVKQATGNKK